MAVRSDGAAAHNPDPGRPRLPRGRPRRTSGRLLTRADQSVLITDALIPFTGIGCLLFAILAAVEFTFHDQPGSWPSSAMIGATAVVLGIAFVVLHSGWGSFLRRRRVQLGLLVGTMVVLNPVVYIYGTQMTYPGIGLLLVIVAVGGLVHDGVWALSLILVLNVLWLLAALMFGIPITPAVFLLHLLMADGLAAVLNLVRTGIVGRFQQAQREVHHLATTDELTGLINQRGLLETIDELPDRLAGDDVDLAVVYVDVDGLKAVNDAHGHQAGEALIRSVADVLRRCFRAQDTLARVGGDEFAIVQAGATPQLAQMLVQRVERQLAERGLAASIGCASANVGPGEVDLHGLLDRADAAMYAAKSARKNGDG